MVNNEEPVTEGTTDMFGADDLHETLAPPMEPWTEREVKVFAREFVQGKWYVAWDERAMEYSFNMVLLFCRPSQIPSNAALCYEEVSAAGPRSVNGYPSFFSCRFIPAESVQAVIAEIQAVEALLEVPE